jgi:hypothetical protein
MPKYILWSLSSREPALDSRGRVIESDRPVHIDEWPAHWPGTLSRRKNNWAFAEIEQTIVDPKHRGPARFEQRDHNVARIRKTVAPPK